MASVDEYLNYLTYIQAMKVAVSNMYAPIRAMSSRGICSPITTLSSSGICFHYCLGASDVFMPKLSMTTHSVHSFMVKSFRV